MKPEDRGPTVRAGERKGLCGRRIALTVIREPALTAATERKRELCWDFGIPPREPPTVIADGLEIELRAGEIVLVTGPSGSGKSSVLAAIAEKIEGCEVVGRARFQRGRAIVDAIAPGRPLGAALEILTACGLGEPRLWVRQYGDMSDGERFRAELARAIGRAMSGAGRTSRFGSPAGGQAACGTHANVVERRRRGCASSGEQGAPTPALSLRASGGGRPAVGGRATASDTSAVGCGTASSPAGHGHATRAILCDEFGAGLHRRLAEAMACNLRKLVTRHQLTLVLTSTNEDVARCLRPDRIVRLGGYSPRVIEGRPGRTACRGPRRRLSVERASLGDYRLFQEMHYRQRDGLGFVDKVFVLREKAAGDALGIVVFAHAPLELAMRNAATNGRFVRNPRRLNRELRILRRLVIHPDVRGCGLGHWFVRRPLPEAGVRFLECLAAMGDISPVFEKAGMARVGPCPLPRGRLALLRRLRVCGLDPFAPEFDRQVARRPRVRRLVEATIRDWAERTQSHAQYKPAGRRAAELTRAFRQIIGRPPVYYLWDREGEFPTRDAPRRSDPGRRPPRDDAGPRSGDLDSGQESPERARHDP